MPPYHYSIGIIRVEETNPHEHYDTRYLLCPHCDNEWFLSVFQFSNSGNIQCSKCKHIFYLFPVLEQLIK